MALRVKKTLEAVSEVAALIKIIMFILLHGT